MALRPSWSDRSPEHVAAREPAAACARRLGTEAARRASRDVVEVKVEGHDGLEHAEPVNGPLGVDGDGLPIGIDRGAKPESVTIRASGFPSGCIGCGQTCTKESRLPVIA